MFADPAWGAPAKRRKVSSVSPGDARAYVGALAEFLIELYVPRTDAAEAGRFAGRARVAAAELTREGTPVRCLRSIFVPEDETCFLLCEAGSAEVVLETAQRAALAFERIAEAVGGPTGVEEVDPCF